MLIAVILGTILSIFIAHMIVNYQWGEEIFKVFKSKQKDWEAAFNGMIMREQMRLGNLIKKGFGPQTKPDARKNGSESLYNGLESLDRESLNIIDAWFTSNNKTVRKVNQTLNEDGKLNTTNIPVKLYMREIVLKKTYSHLKGNKLQQYLISRVYLRAIREEIKQRDSIYSSMKLNENIDMQKGILLSYLLKGGGAEKSCRQQILKSISLSISMLKGFPETKKDSIEREIINLHSSVKSLFIQFRLEARKQSKYESEFQKEQTHKKSKSSSSSQQKKTILNPQKVQDALQILEMSRVIDLNSLKKKYRKMAMEHHPDRINKEPLSAQKQAHEKFVKINSAFQTLSKKCG